MTEASTRRIKTDSESGVESPAGTETKQVEQDQIQVIAEEAGLSNTAMMAAILEACGAKPKEISKRLGRSTRYLYQLRQNNPNYPPVVKQLLGVVSRRIIDQVTDVEELFNSQIGPSVATMMEVRDNPWAKDEARLKAAIAFLDRAPRAPKTTTQQDVRQVRVNIPLSAMQGMQMALEEDRGVEGQEILQLSRLQGAAVAEAEIIEEEAEVIDEKWEIEARRVDW